MNINNPKRMSYLPMCFVKMAFIITTILACCIRLNHAFLSSSSSFSSSTTTTTSSKKASTTHRRTIVKQRTSSSFQPMIRLQQQQNSNDDEGTRSETTKSSSSPSSDSTSIFEIKQDDGTAASSAKFGDVMPLKRPESSNNNGIEDSSSSSAVQFGDVMPLKRPSSSSSSPTTAGFGDVVPMKKPEVTATEEESSPSTTSTQTQVMVDPKQMKRRNTIVAVGAVILALLNYAWQFTHPIAPIQLLYTMEQNSAPVTSIGTTSKPTVVDFWAPWCENCKYMAPTLRQVEEDYADKVNFVMINGDSPEAWPLIEAFGVDAIPHLALVEADGTVDTALIGPVPKQWLESDLQVLINNAKQSSTSSTDTTQTKKPLPYQMLDVFANRPDDRRIVVNPRE